MDNFAEYMVKKRPDSRDNAKRAGIVALAVVLCAASVFLVFVTHIPFILLITCAIIYGAYFLITGTSVEYEYAVTNGEMDVDKIIAKRKRKHMLTVRIAEFETFGLESEAKFDNNITTFLVGDGDEAHYYAADFQHEGMGRVRLVFSPNERILEAIRPSLKRGLR